MEQALDTDLEQLRIRHKVRPLESDEEGFATGRLPNGVYGFTYAPAQDQVPLFANKTWHSFEIHKLGDGTEHLVGFVTAAEAETVRKGLAAEIELLPDPWEQARELVSIPLSRATPSKKGPSRDGGNGLKIVLIG